MENLIPLEELLQKLIDALQAEGSVLFSQVPDRLKPHSYKDYSNGMGLKTWLLSFPDFAVSEDGLSIRLANPPAPMEVAPAPAVPDDTGMGEVRCMHRFAYMNFWTQNLKQLKQLGEFSDLKANQLRDWVAHSLMHDLFTGVLEIDLSDPNAPYLYLDTGLTLSGDYPVYAVLGLNPLNTDGQKQFWLMNGFGSTAGSDTSELGERLRAYFGNEDIFDYAELCDLIDQIDAAREGLQTHVREFLEVLNTGACPTIDHTQSVSTRISQYEEQWESLLLMLNEFPGLLPVDQAITLSALRSVTKKETFRADLLRQAINAFDELTTGLESFFQENHWTSHACNTPAAHHKALYEDRSQSSTASFLLTMAETYEKLRSLLSCQQADTFFYDTYDSVIADFPELPEIRIAQRVLPGYSQEELSFFWQLEQLRWLLEQYAAAEDEDEQTLAPILPEDTDTLLQLALKADTQYEINWPRYLREALPGQAHARSLVTHPADPEAELTCHGVAQRLLEAGEMAYAERYLILGLQYEFSLCAPLLLKLYRQTGRAEAFDAAWSNFSRRMPTSPEDDAYRFGIISVRSPQEAILMATTNLQLQYLPEYLEKLITAAQALNNSTLAETFRTRLERLTNQPEPDAFETLLTEGDPDAISQFVDSDALQALFPEAEQLQRIRDLAKSREYTTGNDPFNIGCRLYQFQKNRHALAEKWMWQGVSIRNQASYAELFLLLMEEGRWEEAITLFEVHAENQKRFEPCRWFYLMAMFYRDPALTREAYTENLQDVLMLLNLRAGLRSGFSAVAKNPELSFAPFYDQILKLYHAVSEPYLWSVLREDRSLRERVNDHGQMAALGLEVGKCSEVYRSSKYPHGTNAASIAARLYALAGNLREAAELSAILAGDDPAAQALLWNIFHQEQDDAAMYDLLRNNQALQQEHHEKYLELLYTRREYAAYLQSIQADDTLDGTHLLQKATAQLSVGQSLSDPPHICAEAALLCKPELCRDFLEAAARAQESVLVSTVVCHCFDTWLQNHPDQLRHLVSCNGSAGAATLEAIREQAAGQNMTQLQIYLHNAMNVGSVPEEANALYEKLQQVLREEDSSARLSAIRTLKYLYPNQAVHFSEEAARISIQALLDEQQHAQVKDLAKEMGAVIQNLEDDPKLFDIVTELLEASEFCWNYNVYTAVWSFAQRVQREEAALMFLHRASQVEGFRHKPFFRDYLINLYYKALSDGSFPVQIPLEEAEAVCFLSWEQNSSVTVALAICMLEQLRGRPAFAGAVLRHMVFQGATPAETPMDMLSQLDVQPIPEALKLPEVLPSSQELFEELLADGSQENILSYLQFCNKFVKGDIGVLQELRHLGGQPGNEDQCSSALDLLCSDPESQEYWNHCYYIPFDAPAVGQATFQYLCCLHRPGLLEDFIVRCESQPQISHFVLKALVAWSQVPGPHSQACRVYLENKLMDKPDYFASLQDPENLQTLTESFCNQLSSGAGAPSHAQMRTVALIAVSTGDPVCLRILERDAGGLLFGSMGNLGFVVAVRLLLTERYEEAKYWISKLPYASTHFSMKHGVTVRHLAALDAQELAQWCSNASNRLLLQMVLPDGNQPGLDQISSICVDAWLNNTIRQTALALRQLMEDFPNDYAYAHALGELCKTGFEGSIPLLHFSLRNMLRIGYVPYGDSNHYYARNVSQNANAFAILNQLIIHKRQMHTIQDWDFTQSTAMALENIGVAVHNINTLNRVEQMVQESLRNQDAATQELLYEAWMAAVTNDWTQYLAIAYRKAPKAEKVFIPTVSTGNSGFTRSLLRFFLQEPATNDPEQAAAEHARRVEWLTKLNLGKRIKFLKLAKNLYDEQHLHRFAALESLPTEQILRFPMENYGLFRHLFNTLLRPSLDSSDKDYMLKGNQYISSLSQILCASSGCISTMRDMVQLADRHFTMGNDEIACILYSALYCTGAHLRISHIEIAEHANPDTAKPDRDNVVVSAAIEMYQARMRICGAFSGHPIYSEVLRKPDLKPWSAINMVLCLATDMDRYNEIEQLISYMDPSRAPVARLALQILDPVNDDASKLAILTDPTLEIMDRYYLSKLLQYPYNSNAPTPLQSVFLQSMESTKLANALNSRLFEEGKAEIPSGKFQKTLFFQPFRDMSARPHISQHQKQAAEPVIPTAAPETEEYTFIPPSYLVSETAIVEHNDGLAVLDALRQKRRQLRLDSPTGRYPEKAELSLEIYRRTLGIENNHEDRYRAMLRLTLDRFYKLLGESTPEATEKAFSMLLPLLSTDGGSVSDGDEYDTLKEMVNNTGVFGLFKTFTTIRELLQAYADHRSAFLKLKSLLRDTVVAENMTIIYNILDKLSERFLSCGDMNVNGMIKALDDADRAVAFISGIGLSDIKAHLQRMIRAERSKLSRRAILDIRLLNSGTQATQGHLHGVVTNRGTVSARALTLQALVADQGENGQYTLAQLPPNSRAIFEIPYSMPENATVLSGDLDLLVKSGDSNVGTSCTFHLFLGETSGESLQFNTYNTDLDANFVYDPETQTVKNDHFFGRTGETDRMRELVKGDNFAEYHSALVYGVRRTGKTSLLEYFRTYVRGARPKCLCIRVDVQATNKTIHGVFVSSVLKDSEILTALEQSQDRYTFIEKWNRATAGGDMDPSLLKEFFRELYEMTGKGLMLIVDEVDRLFKRMMDDHMEAALNELMASISAILDDSDCKKWVHLVLCGSNWMMYYAAVGQDMQQMFHRFGDYAIPVGRLPMKDVLALLNSAKVDYTTEAKDLIWEYTGGLVWFVKLLGNAAIRRAKNANRSRIYPADVFYSLPEVLSDRNCEQFYEGCPAGGLERKLIDAMQALANRKDKYIPMDKLCQMLGSDPEDVVRALRNLKRFDIAEAHAVRTDDIRFSLDIYRRYFRTVHSAFPREPEEPIIFEKKFEGGYIPLDDSTIYSDDDRI